MSRPSVAERRAEGREAVKRASRSPHAEWVPGPDRRHPVTLLEEQNAFAHRVQRALRDQNQTDHEAFRAAIADARVPVADGI